MLFHVGNVSASQLSKHHSFLEWEIGLTHDRFMEHLELVLFVLAIATVAGSDR